ncbi:MAG TPA: hypothetical protein DEA46_03615 [Candidatus Moranbacteria bacterium]|nr:hypothetical protein [Candidatus Moranbacteria bacterium]
MKTNYIVRLCEEVLRRSNPEQHFNIKTLSFLDRHENIEYPLFYISEASNIFSRRRAESWTATQFESTQITRRDGVKKDMREGVNEELHIF